MVVYEAASAIVNLPGCSAKELAPAVSGAQAPPPRHPPCSWVSRGEALPGGGQVHGSSVGVAVLVGE